MYFFATFAIQKVVSMNSDTGHIIYQDSLIASEGVLITVVDNMPVYNEPFISPCYVIGINHRGVLDVEYDMQRRRFVAHDISIIYPYHSLTAFSKSPDYEATLIVVSPDIFAATSSNIVHFSRLSYEQDPQFSLTEKQYSNLMTLVEASKIMMHLSSDSKSDDIKISALNMLVTAINSFRTTNSVAVSTTRRQLLCHKFYDALIYNYTEHRDVDFYARLMCVSRRYFSSEIRKATGHSAAHWIQRYVVSNAKMIMRNRSELSLQAVADNLGFPDVSSFSRYFKREEGISPSEWRDSMQHNAIGGMERLF